MLNSSLWHLLLNRVQRLVFAMCIYQIAMCIRILETNMTALLLFTSTSSYSFSFHLIFDYYCLFLIPSAVMCVYKYMFLYIYIHIFDAEELSQGYTQPILQRPVTTLLTTAKPILWLWRIGSNWTR